MSELVALASLVDNVPSVEVQPAPADLDDQCSGCRHRRRRSVRQPAGRRDGRNDQPLDPAEYARRELARLQQRRKPPTGCAPKPSLPATTEPGATAEQRRHRLAGRIRPPAA